MTHALDREDPGICSSKPTAPASASCQSEPRSVGLDGTSGHSNVRRLQFALGGYGPFVSLFVLLFAKDMYILKFGGNADRIGVVTTVSSILFPIMYPIAGQLMDREPLLLNFPTWGRRAPWFISHLIPLSVVAGIVFLPGLVWMPAAGSWVLDAWLGFCLLIGAWCCAVLLDTFESARAEIYPFKEERVLVEAMTKFIGGFAAITGIVPQFVLWIVATLPVRAGMSCFFFVAILCSLQATPVLKDARQPRDTAKTGSTMETVQVLRSSPMAHATAVRFWHSAADLTATNFSMYYLTFVDGLDSAQRAQWMLIAGVFVAGVEFLVLLPLWGVAWTKPPSKPSRVGNAMRRLIPDVQTTCFSLHVAGAVLPPLLLRLLPLVLPTCRPWEWVISYLVLRACYSPQTFFRTNSFCWAVDDDCHRGGGRRREAVHAGAVRLFEDEGRSLTFALVAGLGLAGLRMENCEVLCEGSADRAGCVSACELRGIESQPGGVRDFVLAVCTFAVPVFGLLCAIHIWLFPIHGERLRQLQEKQAVLFKNVSDSAVPAPATPRSPE